MAAMVSSCRDSGLQMEELNEIDEEVTNGKDGKENTCSTLRNHISINKMLNQRFFNILIHLTVAVYFGFATKYFIETGSMIDTKLNPDGSCYSSCGIQFCDGYGLLLLCALFIYVGLGYFFIIKRYFGTTLYRWLYLVPKAATSTLFSGRLLDFLLVAVILAGFTTFLYFETRNAPQKLTSLTGPIVFLIFGYIFSTDRGAIKWRPVLFGITLQFLLGVICIRWSVGRTVFQCLGDKVAGFLRFASTGSAFVFGTELIEKQIFAFAILPVIFFFSFFISILYYMGSMQWIIVKLGWILQTSLGTTVCESVIAAANIFLGMSESPLLIRPYLEILTESELHAIMASGFATVSGTVLAAYISFGADPALLITSSVMAAPGGLAISKLYFPENKESKTKSNNIQMTCSNDSSLLDAACKGANSAVEIVLGIIANLVAFVSFVAFINAIISWLAQLVGHRDITFEWIFAKIFIPLSWSLGIEWGDCDIAAKVIATKTIINEFVAYERLGYFKNQTMLKPRSVGITTFAICGFANPSSLGILIGSLSAMAPNRRSVITGVAFRAFIVGCIICFMSASFAGLLITDEMFIEAQSVGDMIFLNSSNVNY